MKRLLTLICSAAITGCGSSGATLTPLSPSSTVVRPQGAQAKAPRAVVFTCQNGSVFDCLVYDKRGGLRRTLTDDVESPLGVAADKDGLLYVANEFADDVLVYSPGARSLLQQLDNGGNVPIDVAVFHGTIAVANQHSVTFFRRGATKPTRTMTDRSVLQGSGIAFDASGNCYWSFSTGKPTTQVDEFVGCRGKPHALIIGAGSPFGMAFDGGGNLYYTSYSSQEPGVYRCSGASSCKLIYSQFIDPQYLNFSSDFKNLWISDPGTVSAGTAIYEVSVATGKTIATITASLSGFNPPSGVAVAPGPF